MVRLQKILANNGSVPSRRVAEAWIKDGRVKVNGQIATLGQKVVPKDKIYIDDILVEIDNDDATDVLIYHKPVGEVCSRVGEDNVFKSLPKRATGRWIVVGRLDVQTSGLLLFTQNGELAQRLMHPSYVLPRVYKVRVHGKVSEEIQHKLCQGIMLDDGMAKFDTFKWCQSGSGTNQWVEVSLANGRNRIVRRMFEEVNVPVNKLMRISYGSVILPRDLMPRQSKLLNASSLKKLCKSVKL